MTSRILVADDQELFAQGISMILTAQPDLEVLSPAHSGEEALRRIAEDRPDVVLLDLRMPGLNGLEVLERHRAEGLPGSVIVLTTLRVERAVYTALRLGAAAYLTKDAPPAQLLDTIRRVLDGDATIGAPELDAILEGYGDAALVPASAVAELSERERTVMLWCARGLDNAEIAQREQVSVATVKSQLSAVLRKLGLQSRVQIAIYAYERGIIRPGGGA